MHVLFKKDETYTFPSGESMTGEGMINSDQFPITENDYWVLDVKNGVVFSIFSLEDVKLSRGIVSEDPEECVSQANAIDTKRKMNEAKVTNTLSSIMIAARFAAVGFTDEQALEVRDLYPAFEIGHDYKKDERFTYNGHLFKVNQNHTSQEQWVPGETGTESLYTSLEMGGNGYLNWQQPTGSHDAYNTGDIVNYKGELCKSLIDGNAWAPDAYPAGWEKYTEPTS